MKYFAYFSLMMDKVSSESICGFKRQGADKLFLVKIWPELVHNYVTLKIGARPPKTNSFLLLCPWFIHASLADSSFWFSR